MPRHKVIVIAGPTASGKSALAVEIAAAIGGEIVSADSMQVYRLMNIGTAKLTEDEMGGIPHHMIDIVDPDEEFCAADYRDIASQTIDDIVRRGRQAIVSGGTGLYIRALTRGLADTPRGDPTLREELKAEAGEYGRGYLHEKLKRLDPEAAAGIHPNNLVRTIRALEVTTLGRMKISEMHEGHRFGESPYDVLMLGVDVERSLLYRRIEERVDVMIGKGLVDEMRGLLEMGYSRDLKPMQGLGYKEMSAHILDGLPIDRAIELIKKESRHYAKRQMTWFRREDVMWRRPEELESGGGLEDIRRFLML